MSDEFDSGDSDRFDRCQARSLVDDEIEEKTAALRAEIERLKSLPAASICGCGDHVQCGPVPIEDGALCSVCASALRERLAESEKHGATCGLCGKQQVEDQLFRLCENCSDSGGSVLPKEVFELRRQNADYRATVRDALEALRAEIANQRNNTVNTDAPVVKFHNAAIDGCVGAIDATVARLGLSAAEGE